MAHAHSQLTATIFVPRRIKYELSSAHEWFKDKERCIFCDTVRQEEKQGKRIVDVQGDYYALCPYASRVPYEIWLMHRRIIICSNSRGRVRIASIGGAIGARTAPARESGAGVPSGSAYFTKHEE